MRLSQGEPLARELIAAIHDGKVDALRLPYIAIEAISALINSEHPMTSYLGIANSIGSITMIPLGLTKRRLGRRLQSRATAGERTQNLLCAYLALAVLAGLLANTLFSAWWLDPLVALIIAAVAIQEGREAWDGDED